MSDDLGEICRNSYAAFCTAIDEGYQVAPHILLMIEALQKIESREWKRLQIWCPPRHSKSETATRKFVPWYMGRNPKHKVMLCCNTQSLASQFGSNIKANILNMHTQKIFPDLKLSASSHAKDQFETTLGGEFFAAGVDTTITGRGFDCLIIDDPIKSWEAAQSPVQRETVLNWYKGTALTRKQSNAAIVVVNTRWHESDLSGWLLDPNKEEGVEDWKILHLPAIAERNEGWREEGDVLWPSMFSLEEMLQTKRAVGSYNWISQYQGRPNALEGYEIKRDWFKYYSWNPHMAANRNMLANIVTQDYMIVQSWDCAVQPGQENDFSVCETYLVTASGYYLLDVWRKKVIAPDLLQAAKELAIYWGADAVLIEEASAGYTLIQMLPALLPGVPLIGVKPRGDKQTRMRTASPKIEGGKFFVPYNAPWLSDFINELVSFPTGAKDDQVDSCSQFLNWVTLRQKSDNDEANNEEPQGNVPIWQV